MLKIINWIWDFKFIMTKKNYIRNAEGYNQWKLRSNEEIQKIINKYSDHWTKKILEGGKK